MKQKLFSMFALLLMAATGAWADTTVTWTADDMKAPGIYIDFLDGEAYNNTIKGITVTASGGGGAGASWDKTDINLYSGSTTITFTSSVGNIKSIAITAEDIMMSDTPSGWTLSDDYKKLSWSGDASTTVSLPLSGGSEIYHISEIVFTIESAPASSTYIVAGNNAEIFGSVWDGTYEANKMTKGGDGKYTKTYNVEDAIDDIQFKVVKDGEDWIGDETGNNVTFSMKQAGSFTVTIDPNANPVCVTVTGDNVVFANAEYAINYATGMQNGTVTGPDAAKEDDEVTLTITPAAGCVLESISVTGVTTENAVEVTDGKFTMPAEDVNVIATFKLVTYAITLAEGTEDGDNWTISPAEAAEGETVTVTYSGERKVKSVKAVKKEAGPGVTTFSELQAALSAGKDVKLMNDIVCTAEIEITSGALTIDGNGKKLSTTSAIRAFKVESSATVAFKNLTLTGFVNGGGPAINNSGTTVLDGCTISNCHVNNTNGGGAIESSGKLYAINTTFSGNYSGEIGGAINNFDGSLYMSGCTFTNNYTTSSNAFYGGAIGINGGDEVRLINCTFSGNKYGTNAGTNDIGVYWKPANYTIAGCIGATIAPRAGVGDITTNASGTATLDYSDLSNISFTVEQGGATAYTMAASATASDKDKLICTDGHIHAYGADAACTKNRVAKIIYVGTTGDATYSHGLALALADEVPVMMNWETAKTACSNKNTSTPVTDATWLLASKEQWDYMIEEDGADGYENLRDGFNSVGGTNLEQFYYWSSTEDNDDSSLARIFRFDNGEWTFENKGNDDSVLTRACLAF